MGKRKLKTYTIVLEWGDREEGLYHWAGQARNDDHAIRLAREDMDHSYNEQYCNDYPPDRDHMKKGKEGGHRTTQYVVNDIIEGVNEYAAADMLAALREVARLETTIPRNIMEKVQHAIARGEGRRIT